MPFFRSSSLSIRRYLGNVMGGSVLLGAALAVYASWLLIDLEQRQNLAGRESLQLKTLESALEQVDILLTSADLAIGAGETYTAELAIELSSDLRGKFSAINNSFPEEYHPSFLELSSLLLVLEEQLSRSSPDGSADPETSEQLLREFDEASLALAILLDDIYVPFRDQVISDGQLVEQLKARVKATLTAVFLIYVMLNLCIILWSLRKIAYPIELLTKGAERSIAFDSEFKLETRGPSEISKMASFFFQLIERLNGKVRERTLELESQTRELEREVDARTKTQIELKSAKERAERSNQVKSEFLSVMSHELRTPLNVVISSLQLLREETDDPYQLKFIDLADQSGQALTDVIGSILEISKIESGELALAETEFSVVEEFAKAISMTRLAAATKGLTMTAMLDPALPVAVTGDDARWRQVVINLLDNAIKYTESGSVSVNLEVDEQQPGCIVVRVRDTGIGIDSHLGQTVFDGFVQADSSRSRAYAGVGLGLKICREIARAMGGQCDYQSNPGQGTEFWFSAVLDVHDSTEQLVQSIGAHAQSHQRVLVWAEDEGSPAFEWIRTLLQAFNFDFHRVASQHALLKELSKNPGAWSAVLAVSVTLPELGQTSLIESNADLESMPLIHVRADLENLKSDVSHDRLHRWIACDCSEPLALLRALSGEVDEASYGSQVPLLKQAGRDRAPSSETQKQVLLFSSEPALYMLLEDYFRQGGFRVTQCSDFRGKRPEQDILEAELVVLAPNSVDQFEQMTAMVSDIRRFVEFMPIILISSLEAARDEVTGDPYLITVNQAIPAKAKLLEIAGHLLLESAKSRADRKKYSL